MKIQNSIHKCEEVLRKIIFEVRSDVIIFNSDAIFFTVIIFEPFSLFYINWTNLHNTAIYPPKQKLTTVTANFKSYRDDHTHIFKFSIQQKLLIITTFPESFSCYLSHPSIRLLKCDFLFLKLPYIASNFSRQLLLTL